jgi:hypothetical protein
LAKDSQKSHSRTFQTKVLAESGGGFPSQCKTQFGKGLSASCRAASIDAGQFGQPFGKNLPRAGFISAKEAANQDQEPQGFSSTGQVSKCTSVVTVNTMGNELAEWASGFRCFYCQGQDERLWRDLDLIQAQVRRQTE